MNAEPQFRFGVLVGGAILVGIITYLRFCGSLSLPPKPPMASGPSGTQSQLLAQATGSPAVYQSFVQNDAATAGVKRRAGSGLWAEPNAVRAPETTPKVGGRRVKGRVKEK